MRAVTPSSSPISSAISPSFTLITVMPVNSIVRPMPAGERADGDVVERVAGVGAAALPLADDVVALGDQVRGALEAEVGECRPERPRELAHLLATA